MHSPRLLLLPSIFFMFAMLCDAHMIMVAGGAGYIGSHVAEELLRRGHSVLIYDNLSTGHRAAVEELIKIYNTGGASTDPVRSAEHPRVSFIQRDVRETDALTNALKSFGVEAVIHLCADSLVGVSMEQPLKYFSNNVGGAISLLQAMADAGVHALVFSSSAAVYGVPKVVPIPETAATEPINPYGLTKLQMEQIIEWQTRATPLRAIALRYFNVGGASSTADLGENHVPETHLIANILRAVLSRTTRDEDESAPHPVEKPGSVLKVFGTDYETRDGTCIRDYVDVRDLAVAHALALEMVVSKPLVVERGSGSFDVFNLGSEAGFSVMEVLSEAAKATHKPVEYEASGRRAGDPPILVASSEKIRKAGWKVTHQLEDTIGSAYAWHVRHGLK